MKQTIPVFLHAQDYGYPDEETGSPYRFVVFGSNMSSSGYIPLGRSDLEFDIPSSEQIVARHAVLLREKIKRVREEAAGQVADLTEQLSKLESLTYMPPAAKEPTDVP